MRILLNTIPRAGSKWLHSNLLNYLRNDVDKFNQNAFQGHQINSWFEGDEFNQNAFQGNIIKRSDNFYFVENKNFDITIEMKFRLDLLLNHESNIVVKIHPAGWHALHAIEKIKQKYDLYYTLRRRNKVEQVLSLVTAQEFGIYSYGSALDEKIIEVIDQPVFIDYRKVKNSYNFISMSEAYLRNQKATKHLYFEDLIELKDPYEFCDYLLLPRKDFEISNKHGIEYGTNKQKILKNYEVIKKYIEFLDRNI